VASVAEVLVDGFERVHEVVHEVLDGLSAEKLAFQPAEGANSIAWLVWHLTRIQDDHLAHVAGTGQVWTVGGWADRFGLGLDPDDTGYGHGPEQVAAVTVDSAELLIGYYDAVHAETLKFLHAIVDDDLDRVVDTNWDPHVTLGVRLVSVISDDLQHAGQAAYIRGLPARKD
jgi:uncharacterized damage-inducible protein DinB